MILVKPFLIERTEYGLIFIGEWNYFKADHFKMVTFSVINISADLGHKQPDQVLLLYVRHSPTPTFRLPRHIAYLCYTGAAYQRLRDLVFCAGQTQQHLRSSQFATNRVLLF